MSEQTGLMDKPKKIWNGALKMVKGENTNQLMEQFTSEMTLVAEGLCEDQSKLHQDVERMMREEDQRIQKLEARISLLEETLVGMDVRCKFFPGTRIGQVAAPLAGEIDLPAEPFVLVEQHHARPVAERHGGPDGCHHSRRSATDDGQAWLHHSK